MSVGLSAATPVGASPADVVAAFHGWIQRDAVDELLIDVVDYSHVPGGPGVLLIGHTGHYAADVVGERPGLRYQRRRDPPGPLAKKLREAAARALAAADRLERDLDGRLRFRGDELVVRIHSRLLAPNDAPTFATARDAAAGVLHDLFGGPDVALAPEPDPRRLLTLYVRGPRGTTAANLRERVTA
ncbi:MAG: hypothetical protein D6689_18595 [Deltaproteobacteria bacterium]|nr:MAG: hypothetical protein D6689_18595 [Deltaproteobacteria bacterium]